VDKLLIVILEAGRTALKEESDESVGVHYRLQRSPAGGLLLTLAFERLSLGPRLKGETRREAVHRVAATELGTDVEIVESLGAFEH